MFLRANLDRLNRYVNDLLAQYYMFDHNKDVQKGLLQFGVRPIQLYELVFPEEHLKDVLEMIMPRQGGKGEKLFKMAFNKMLGAENIDHMIKDLKPTNKRYLYGEHVDKLLIGVRGDPKEKKTPIDWAGPKEKFERADLDKGKKEVI